jgi:hypothetical protein
MLSFKTISVKAKLMTLIATFVAGTLAFGTLAYVDINAVTVGSQLQHQVSSIKDLISDYTFPPASLLPANFYLYRSETARGSSDIASNITGVATAAKETQHSAGVSRQAAQELSKLAVRLGGVVSQFKLSDHARPLDGAAR